MRVIQVNLHHSRAATAALCKVMSGFDIALIQEPWTYKGNIRGLSGGHWTVIYCTTSENPRTCIIVRKGINILPLTDLCCRDLVAVQIKSSETEGPRGVTLGSVYLPYDDPNPPPTPELVNLVNRCRGTNGSHLVIGCDANAHHSAWASTNINRRGESLFEFIMANNLDIINTGNTPTFVTCVRQEIIDITLATPYISNYIRGWHVSDEESCSDHRYICFNIEGLSVKKDQYRNPRRTNWESYKVDLNNNLKNVETTIQNHVDLEFAAEQLREAIISAYEENCQVTTRIYTRNTTWWNNELGEQRRRVRKLFNKAKRSGRWDEYRTMLTDYNKNIRTAKYDSWRKHCESIDSTSESARLQRILAKGPQQPIGSLQTSAGTYTKMGSDTIQELLRVHFPGSILIEEPIGGWAGLASEPGSHRPTREDWSTAKTIVTAPGVKCALESFEPYKTPGPDGILPIMLQQESDLLTAKITNILRASLALGYIPMTWRIVRVAYIPKPGRPCTQARALRPISLMSFILKTLEKLMDGHIRNDVLARRPLHRDQHAYRSGLSTDTALFQVTQRLEKAINQKEVALGAFLDIQGAFDNTSFRSIIRAVRSRGTNDTCCRWIGSMLECRMVQTTLMGQTLTAKVAGGCPQGGVLSPLLWNLVVDELLVKLGNQGHNTVGYADDIAIIEHGLFNETVRDRMQEALDIVTQWAENEGLKVSPEKTAIIPFTRRRNLDGLGPLRISNQEIPLQGETKYLGVILDTKLSWNQHLDKIIRKSEITFSIIRRMYGKTWGLKPKMVHYLYTKVIRPTITYASLIWWSKTRQTSAINKLSRLQRMACLAITGGLRSTPTTSMEVLLDLPPLDILIRAEARMALYRIKLLDHRPISQNKTMGSEMLELTCESILEMRSDHMTSVRHTNKNFEVIMDRSTDLETYKFPSGGLVWYTDGSKTHEGTGAGVHGVRPRKDLVFALGQYASVFQSEVYAILQCVRENKRRSYSNKRIYILSDSQAALGALKSFKVKSRLIMECLNELTALAGHNRVTLMWVPGHKGIEGNERADELAREGSANKFVGPEPVLGIPKCTARAAVKKQVRLEHIRHWDQTPGNRHGKLFISKPSNKKAEELLKLSRIQLRTVTWLLTGHAPVRRHLHTMSLYHGNLDCRLCGLETETAQHLLCDCEALTRRRYTILGMPLAEPDDFSTLPPRDLLRMVRGTGLFE